jgi:TolB-like protein/DNA-binding winged helix-turn-helix (wHTH) protein/cytochrome c-type biogenesis protein CcmH/NrfG
MPKALQVRVRFGPFELDPRAGELHKNGQASVLQEQQLKVLLMLIERKGEIATREDIKQRLWPTDTVVEFDHGINNTIKNLRRALGDSADSPNYIETLARRGYRFIAPVTACEFRAAGSGDTFEATLPEPGKGLLFIGVSEITAETRPAREDFSDVNLASVPIARHIPKPRLLVSAGVLVLMGVGSFWGWSQWRRSNAAPVPIRSIAVLPLADLSGDASQDYFADGMTDELITDLAQISSLRVVSRTSVMKYKHSNKTLPEIARELNVNAIVEGSVMRSGEQVRITAQLVDARDDHHLWAQSYQRPFIQLLSLQNEVARDIALQVRVELTPLEQARLSTRLRMSPDNYVTYLKGRYYIDQSSEESMAKAIDCFKAILAQDPSAAIAYAGIAEAYLLLGTPEAIPRARDAAQKALALDPTLSEARESLADILLSDWDVTASGAEVRRVLASRPNSPSAHGLFALQLLALGDFEQALEENRKAIALDPLSVKWVARAEMIAFFSRNYPQVAEFANRVLAVEPRRERALYWLGYSYEQQGDFARALAEYAKADPSEDVHGIMLAAMGRSYALSGKVVEARQVEERLRKESSSAYVWPYDFALFYSAMGRNDLAFRWLEKCYLNRDSWLVVMKEDPRLQNLHSDPRFAALVRRIELRPLEARLEKQR